jgi:hypothetical protein
VGLLLISYYVANALIAQGRTNPKQLAYLVVCYVGTLTLLALCYAFVLLINTFPLDYVSTHGHLAPVPACGFGGMHLHRVAAPHAGLSLTTASLAVMG